MVEVFTRGPLDARPGHPEERPPHASRLQQLIDEHADAIGHAFGLTDRRFYHLGHAHFAESVDSVVLSTILNRRAAEPVIEWLESQGIASAPGPVRVPSNPDLEMAARVCVPIRFRDLLLGYLWLIDGEEPVDSQTLAKLSQAASEIGAELYSLRYLQGQAQEQEVELLRAFSMGGPVKEEVTWRMQQLLAPSGCYVAIVVEAALGTSEASRISVEIGAAIGHVRRARTQGDVAAAVVDGRGLLAVAIADEHDAERQGDFVLTAARQMIDADRLLAVGVGSAVDCLEAIPQSFEQAQHAVRMARHDAGGGCVSWGSLGADRPIVALVGDRDPTPFLPSSVRRLLEADSAEATLMETLWHYLELAGDAQAAAGALYVHRSTLYHRLHRIEELTGCDLSNGDHRLELHLGLRLSRLAHRNAPS